ncbi:MAG TPA: DNA-directed RNA polymerase subunit omega [Chthoniobacterales bacterium]
MNSHLVEEASQVVGNTQILINIVSKRVRQLSSGQRPLVEVGPRMGLADVALTEVIEGKLKVDLPEGAPVV